MTTLYIVRHGNTFEGNEPPRRIGRRTDLPLTAAGLQQARMLGEHFAGLGIRFARAFAGPLKRTVATGEAILARQAHPLVLEPAEFLAEIDHGPDEDQPEAAVLARIGRGALELWDSAATPPPGWTVDREARLAAWQRLADEMALAHRDEAVLLVTSNGAARFALLAFGIGTGARPDGLKLRTGSYGVLTIGSGKKGRLMEWDRRPT